MRVHCVVYRHKSYLPGQPHNVLWGRSARWAGSIRKKLRAEGWTIIRSDPHEIAKVKSGLLNWLNAHIKIID